MAAVASIAASNVAVLARKAFVGQAVKASAKPAGAKPVSTVVRADLGKKWYTGAKPPAYLDGSMPGDYGYDPLRMGGNPELLKWYQQGEIENGRWAMIGVAGMLFTDALTQFGISDLPDWYEAGAVAQASSPFDLQTLIAIEIFVFATVEGFRISTWKKTGKPGFLDIMGMDSPDMRLKEIKNGRLAMFAFVGFVAQYFVNGMGPVEGLLNHLENPQQNNVFSTEYAPLFFVATVAINLWGLIAQAQTTLRDPSKGEEEFRPIPW
uniref:Chlorophyll a-b binding protein, chloroplastic n=1 Tax=Mesostigma viride TaxID=41882 RepID=A2SY15_MESVI|nr:light-harvesting chlorophyll-a/b binding protein Lhca4.1 [Mesostigma viride]DAA05923.1 TPA_inf: chloroplast light-harvesting complex I protein precursor Lhca2 [Mesostigma viride]|eukprot:jgi/Mesvir1/746/Mv17347-RA.1